MSTAPESTGLLELDISPDDYAKVAATDQEAPISAAEAKKARTHQSETDFQAEKAGYEAKIDNGDLWKKLKDFDPPFPSPTSTATATATACTDYSTSTAAEPETKRKLDKKEWLLLSSAVGELYWAEDFNRVVAICDWAEENFELEARMGVKMGESVKRWRERSLARLEEAGKEQEG